ncbi:hypothetical protein [Kangiella sediminilitoris]|uniref:Membrane protein n=1 Tax=Kangiella sediminilitoris TaxID=1144748 RepID=A0A1B3BBV5_9GAMM|nr:hypothetical protein [Kangiella sediminilitoris]AOE50247.1 membrane protein [Kangiella sediminilitoris]
MSIKLAKSILTENSKVLYGIFGLIESSGFFPPRNILNQFLEQGYDPCDQDGRMDNWKPFTLNNEEYQVIANWWLSQHPVSSINDLGVSHWDDWSVKIIDA